MLNNQQIQCCKKYLYNASQFNTKGICNILNNNNKKTIKQQQETEDLR